MFLSMTQQCCHKYFLPYRHSEIHTVTQACYVSCDSVSMNSCFHHLQTCESAHCVLKDCFVSLNLLYFVTFDFFCSNNMQINYIMEWEKCRKCDSENDCRKIWHTSDLGRRFVKSQTLKQSSVIKCFNAIKYVKTNNTVNAFNLLANRAVALVHGLVLLLMQ